MKSLCRQANVSKCYYIRSVKSEDGVDGVLTETLCLYILLFDQVRQQLHRLLKF